MRTLLPYFFLLPLFLCLTGPLSAQKGSNYVQEKVLRMADFEYEPNIRTVLLVPGTGRLTDDFELPITELALRMRWN